MSLASIRDYYGVPAKRGTQVRSPHLPADHLATIAGADKSFHRLRVSIQAGEKRRVVTLHPFDVDYLIDDNWISGERLKQQFDDALKRRNILLNAKLGKSDGEAK